MGTALSVTDRSALEGLEAIIENARRPLVEMAGALKEIRDRKLYRETHGTFEGYCENRWHISKPYAYRLIEHIEVVQNIQNVAQGTVLPQTERQTRVLATIPAKKTQARVWKQAVKTAPNINGVPQLSAAHVAETAKKVAAKDGKNTGKDGKKEPHQRSGEAKKDVRLFERLKNDIGHLAPRFDLLNKAFPGPKFNREAQSKLNELLVTLADWEKATR